MNVVATEHVNSLCCLASKTNQSEVYNREQKIAQCKQELGTKYLLHPSNFIKHKDGRQS